MKTSKRKIKRPRPSYKKLYTSLKEKLTDVEVRRKYCDAIIPKRNSFYPEEFECFGIKYSREFFYQVYMLKHRKLIDSDRVENIICAKTGETHSDLIRWVFSKTEIVVEVINDTLYLGFRLGDVFIRKEIHGLFQFDKARLSLNADEILDKIYFLEREAKKIEQAHAKLAEAQVSLREELGF